MAKRRRNTNQNTIDKRIGEGRGQGRGSDYEPWLRIQDVPSTGLVTRIKGWKTNRVHHLLSNLELSYFYVLEWSSVVNDIREQYPLLPIEETIAIAEQCGISHPKDPKTQEPVVMTTDFFITVRQSFEIREQARTLKLAQDLQSKRTLEKLEIERQYWKLRDIDWGIVTEREIPEILAKNIEWLHPYLLIENLSPLSEKDTSRVATAMTRKLLKNNLPLADITAECDDLLGLSPGTCLLVSRHLIANRHWLVDMNVSIQPNKPLVFLSPPSIESFSPIRGAAI